MGPEHLGACALWITAANSSNLDSFFVFAKTAFEGFLRAHGRKVLMVDCDSQCNLTAYALQDKAIEKAWEDAGNSIYRAIEPVARGIGDIRNRVASQICPNLYLFPGDLLLSDFEDLLGDTWNSAKGGSEPALRTQSAIYRAILQAAEKSAADVILVDLEPNLGSLNRAVLGGSDYVIVPVAPDLFSIRGTENLGSKLAKWRKEWDQCNASWSGDFPIPKGRPSFLGYVMQQHNIRDNATGMTQGWQIFGNRLESAIKTHIVDRLSPLGQVSNGKPATAFNLGKIPNLHSLIPYSLEARKPVFPLHKFRRAKGRAHPAGTRQQGAFRTDCERNRKYNLTQRTFCSSGMVQWTAARHSTDARQAFALQQIGDEEGVDHVRPRSALAWARNHIGQTGNCGGGDQSDRSQVI